MGTAFFKARGYYPAVIHGKKYKCDPYHISFWRAAAKGAWEPETYKVLDEYLKPDMVYYDIGAWIGPTVLYAAGKTKKVICFEPDRTAYKYLTWNIDLNSLDNVTSFNAALSSESGVMRMSSFGGGLGDSMTSLLNPGKSDLYVDALVLGWNELIKIIDVNEAKFIKMDIEGGEFDLIPTMKDYLSKTKPILYLSLHGKFLPAEDREASFNKIVDALAGYSRCLNEDMEMVDINCLLEPEVLKEARTFLLMP
ncbi:hypothetical protein BVX97_04280 [bacterium E08(2017)]|nr:hypothetical protein BVX97_04280 [bacterium E08(2017)]